MSPGIWESLAGTVVDGRIRLLTLTYAGRTQAEFSARMSEEAGGRTLLLTLVEPPPGELETMRARMEDIARLQHPNLLAVVATGTVEAQGTEVLYLASESPEQTLAARLAAAVLRPPAADELVRDLVPALEYLHAAGLVYRSLEPPAVVRAEGRWKLADFGRLHRAGQPDPEIQAFLNGSRYTPPEAYSGIVTPAWDIWGVVVLLSEVLTGRPEHAITLPEPFEQLALRCNEKEPAARPSLREVLALLGPAPARPGGLLDAPPPAVKIPPGVPAPPPRQRPLEAEVARSQRTRKRKTGLPAWLGAGAVPVLGLIVVAAIVWSSRSPQASPPPESSRPAAAAKAKEAPKPKVVIERPSPMLPARKTPRPAPEPETRRTDEPVAVPRDAEVGRADFASPQMDGRRTASGEKFDSDSLTAAHPSSPLGSRLRVTNLSNGRSVVVRVNDRGALRRGYVIRLTRRAASELGFAGRGSERVSVAAVR